MSTSLLILIIGTIQTIEAHGQLGLLTTVPICNQGGMFTSTIKSNMSLFIQYTMLH